MRETLTAAEIASATRIASSFLLFVGLLKVNLYRSRRTEEYRACALGGNRCADLTVRMPVTF